MISKKIIRTRVEEAAPQTHITSEAVEFIEEACDHHLQRLIVEAIKEQEEMNGRLSKCNLSLKKRLNVTHLRTAQRRIMGGV